MSGWAKQPIKVNRDRKVSKPREIDIERPAIEEHDALMAEQRARVYARYGVVPRGETVRA